DARFLRGVRAGFRRSPCWCQGRVGGRQFVQADTPKQFVQVMSLDELHGVEVDPLIFADAEDRDNVRMVQPSHHLRLAPEAFLEMGTTAARQYLERNGAVQ